VALPAAELAEYGFFHEHEFAALLTDRLVRRITVAHKSRSAVLLSYLELGWHTASDIPQ
jgi:hypothetical protein